MAHKFDPKNKHKLDSAERREMLPPFETLIGLGLKEGDIMADIGCGIGYFTFPASEIVGERGKVYAMDTSSEMLSEVEKNITSNILTVQTEENDLKIPERTATFAFMSNVLHETETKERFLNEVNRIIADNGRIAIIDWKKIDSESGPPMEHRLDQNYVVKLLRDVGFKNINTSSIGEDFYAVTGEK